MASLRVWQPGWPEEACRAEAERRLEEYGLSRYRRYSPYMLSQGQQRRLAVLSVLCGGQKLLLLDEPTYGQDARSVHAIMAQLRGKVDAGGLSVIFITHDRALAAAWRTRSTGCAGKSWNRPAPGRRYETVSGTMEPDGQGGHGAGLRDPFVGAVSCQPQPGGVRPLCGAAAGGVRCGLRRLAALLLPAGMAALGLFFMGLYYARGGAGRHRRAGCGVGPALCGAGGHVPQPVHRPAAGHAAAGLRGAGHAVRPVHQRRVFHRQPAAPVPSAAPLRLWHPGGFPPDARHGAGSSARCAWPSRCGGCTSTRCP